VKLTPRQKKIVGISVVILAVITELYIVAVFIPVFINDGPPARYALQVFLAIGFVLFLLTWGYRVWRSGAWETSPKRPGPEAIGAFREDTVIKIRTKVELADYRRVVFLLEYSSPVILYTHLVIIYTLVAFPLSYEDWLSIASVAVMVGNPVYLYQTSKSRYRSNKMLHEAVTYVFTPVTITITGESFAYNVYWVGLRKFQETKRWMLLYTGRNAEIIIPKSAFASPEEIELFRSMARMLPV
jgi:hypothetical protein